LAESTFDVPLGSRIRKLYEVINFDHSMSVLLSVVFFASGLFSVKKLVFAFPAGFFGGAFGMMDRGLGWDFIP
jgi:hypothetical protein